MAPLPSENNCHQSLGQTCTQRHGDQIGARHDLQCMTFTPCLQNGLKHEQSTDSFQVQLEHDCSQHHHRSVGVDPWHVHLEQEHMRRVGQAPLNSMLLANLKHKLPLPSGDEVLATKSAGSSCMASLEEALFHSQAQNHTSHSRPSYPVELASSPCSNFQAHLFKHEHGHQHDLGDSYARRLQSTNLVQNVSGHETFQSTSPPCIPTLAPSMDAWQPPNAYWRTAKEHAKTDVKEIGSCGRKSLSFECSKALDVKFSTGNDDLLSTVVSLLKDPLSIPCGHIPTTDLSKLLPRPGGGSCQQAELLDDFHRLATHSNHRSWSSEPVYTVSSETEQEVEGGNCFSVWRNGGTVESSQWLEDWTRCNKRARGMCEPTNFQQEAIKCTDVKNVIRKNLSVEEFQAASNDYQSPKALVPEDSGTYKSSVLGGAIKLVDKLQGNVKVSKSITSSASDNTQFPTPISRNLSPTASMMHGLNDACFKQEPDYRNVQLQCGGDISWKVGPKFPLVKLAGSPLENGEDLEGIVLNVVDGIPQIEVRMMENELVMIKLSSKDRPGLFTDIMFALQDLHLQVQHATIRTISGVVHDVFAAKVDVLLAEKQTTSAIAAAIRQAVQNGNETTLLYPNSSINSSCGCPLQLNIK